MTVGHRAIRPIGSLEANLPASPGVSPGGLALPRRAFRSDVILAYGSLAVGYDVMLLRLKYVA
jgi:hypothetical protein